MENGFSFFKFRPCILISLASYSSSKIFLKLGEKSKAVLVRVFHNTENTLVPLLIKSHFVLSLLT